MSNVARLREPPPPPRLRRELRGLSEELIAVARFLRSQEPGLSVNASVIAAASIVSVNGMG